MHGFSVCFNRGASMLSSFHLISPSNFSYTHADWCFSLLIWFASCAVICIDPWFALLVFAVVLRDNIYIGIVFSWILRVLFEMRPKKRGFGRKTGSLSDGIPGFILEEEHYNHSHFLLMDFRMNWFSIIGIVYSFVLAFACEDLDAVVSVIST